jgi:hypothetical protein
MVDYISGDSSDVNGESRRGSGKCPRGSLSVGDVADMSVAAAAGVLALIVIDVAACCCRKRVRKSSLSSDDTPVDAAL